MELLQGKERRQRTSESPTNFFKLLVFVLCHHFPKLKPTNSLEVFISSHIRSSDNHFYRLGQNTFLNSRKKNRTDLTVGEIVYVPDFRLHLLNGYSFYF